MKKEKILSIAVVMLLLLNLGTLGFLYFNNGQGAKNRPENYKPDKLIIEGLKLNEAQVAQFEIIKKEHREQIIKAEQSEMLSKELLFDLLEQDNIDQTTTDSLIEQLSQLKKSKDKATFEHFLKLKAICNKEQIPLYNKVIEDIAKILMRSPKGNGPPPLQPSN